MKKRVKPKSRELMKEISDIVKNSETDEAALAFLKETLEDDYPDLDLGRMDLHEASEVLALNSRKRKKNNSVGLDESLNDSLGNFIDRREKKTLRKRRRRRRGRKRK